LAKTLFISFKCDLTWRTYRRRPRSSFSAPDSPRYVARRGGAPVEPSDAVESYHPGIAEKTTNRGRALISFENVVGGTLSDRFLATYVANTTIVDVKFASDPSHRAAARTFQVRESRIANTSAVRRRLPHRRLPSPRRNLPDSDVGRPRSQCRRMVPMKSAARSLIAFPIPIRSPRRRRPAARVAR